MPALREVHLTAATTMYRDMDMRFWLERADSEMGRWHEVSE